MQELKLWWYPMDLTDQQKEQKDIAEGYSH